MFVIGGSNTKITEIHHRLTTTPFDIIILQETWLKSETSSDEFIHSTNFQMIRHDRSAFQISFSTGGGLAIIINNKFVVKAVPQIEISTAELAICKIEKAGAYFYIVNVYLPPYSIKRMRTMISELKGAITNIRKEEKDATIIVAGDFNLPMITWIYDEDGDTFLSPSPLQYPPREDTFLNNMAAARLFQINQHTNSRGKYLDLVFTTHPEDMICEPVIDDLLIDKNSAHHRAMEINMRILSAPTDDGSKVRYTNVNYRDLRANMVESEIPQAFLSHNDITQASPVTAREWGEDFAAKLFELQNNATKSYLKERSTSKHPWAKGKQFCALSRRRKNAKNKYTHRI